MLPASLTRKPTSTWSGNTLLAIVVLFACIAVVVLLFVLRGGTAQEVCQRLGLGNCYDPLPVVSRMAAFNPMHAVFATLSTVGALLLRNSIAAFIDAHLPILEAYPEGGRLRPATVAAVPFRGVTSCQLHASPLTLARVARVCTDLAAMGLAGLSIVSLAQSWWIHNALSSLFFFFGYAMVATLVRFQSVLRADFPDKVRRLLGDDRVRANAKLLGLVLVGFVVFGLYLAYWTTSTTAKATAYGYLRAIIQYCCLAGLMGFAGVLWADWRWIEHEARESADTVGGENQESVFSDIEISTVESRERGRAPGRERQVGDE